MTVSFINTSKFYIADGAFAKQSVTGDWLVFTFGSGGAVQFQFDSEPPIQFSPRMVRRQPFSSLTIINLDNANEACGFFEIGIGTPPPDVPPLHDLPCQLLVSTATDVPGGDSTLLLPGFVDDLIPDDLQDPYVGRIWVQNDQASETSIQIAPTYGAARPPYLGRRLAPGETFGPFRTAVTVSAFNDGVADCTMNVVYERYR
jgi:hypothetical protein